MPNECIDTIITSPPYWGLRDYGEETKVIWDGDKDCKHTWETQTQKGISGGTKSEKVQIKGKKNFQIVPDSKYAFCQKCGAWYGQLGLEPTLDLFISHLLQITTELKRVLKKTGVMFWNHGDAYASGGTQRFDKYKYGGKSGVHCGRARMNNYQQKCMLLQNYRLILRMIDEQGWILRNTIIWHKPNHMPSSVKDRFANSYEPVFMLTKNKKYWFDLDAVRKPHSSATIERNKYPHSGGGPYAISRARKPGEFGYGLARNKTAQENYKASGMRNAPEPNEPNAFNLAGKNPGDLWTIPTQPFPAAHFATFPEKLIIPMIKAGCPKEICNKCGKARVRITKPTEEYAKNLGKSWHDNDPNKAISKGQRKDDTRGHRTTANYQTLGWTDCGCDANWRPGITLDPFMGAGTTAVVAKKLGRNYIGIELNPEYIKIAEKRIANTEGTLF